MQYLQEARDVIYKLISCFLMADLENHFKLEYLILS